jgi:putative ABC transport system permease protein
LHPELRIAEGRAFSPALRELIVGDSAARLFEGLRVGSQVALADGEWTIVGRFVSDGNALQSQLVGDVRSVMSAFHAEEFDDVIAMVASRESLRTLQAALNDDPTLGAQVQRESDYYENRSSGYYAVLRAIAFAIGSIMSIGALLGAVNTFYSTVSARAVEMATLRAIGFGAGAVMFGVLAEALVIGLVGAACGAGLAWLLFNGNTVSMLAGLNNSQLVYSLRVTRGLVLLGIVWGCVTGLFGGFFPALRAARQPVATALRAI